MVVLRTRGSLRRRVRAARASGRRARGSRPRARRAPSIGSPRRSVAPVRSPCRIVPCSLSSHHSRASLDARAPPPATARPRTPCSRRRRRRHAPDGQHALIQRTPPRRTATNAPAEISPTTSPLKTCSQPPSYSSALEREAARDVVGVALDDHRLALALGGPRAELDELAGARRAARRRRRADSSARWQTRSG